MSMFRSPNDVSSSVDESSNAPSLSHEQSFGRNQSRRFFSSGLSGTKDIDATSSSRIIAKTSTFNIQNLQPHQRQGLLQLAFVESRCQDAALMALNKNRAPDDQLHRDNPQVEEEAMKTYSELVMTFNKTLMLPAELIGPEGKQIRQSALTGLDTMLYNSTTSRLNGIESGSSVWETPMTNASIELGGPTQFQSLQLVPNGNRYGSSAPSLMMGGSTSLFANPSPYKDEHQEICLLGRGGYGQVWKVRNHLDNQLYAVKKIVITSQRLQKFSQERQVEALLAELRTLAKLHHTNVVRYYHGWIENTDPLAHSTSLFGSNHQNLLENPSTIESSTSQSASQDILRVEELSLNSDSDDLRTRRVRTRPEIESDDGGIVFGEDSISQDQDKITTAERDRRASRGTNSSTHTYTKASLHTVGEDDDVEVIPRPPNRQLSLSHIQTSKDLSQDGNNDELYHYYGPDITLFIKMSLHPTTLSNFLSPDPPHADEAVQLRHCFHQKPSVDMLAAMLDGIEYLHSQRIVHRDLKPANIFLSVHKDRPPATSGFVNLQSCGQCTGGNRSNSENQEALYLTPCIGDFGLIAEMKDNVAKTDIHPVSPPDVSPSSSLGTSTFEPSPLAQLQAAKPVGTQFYRPNKMPAKEPKICPKLDVYSLGVIAFELLCKFGTRTERAIKLTDLGRGELPEDFKDHELSGGILSMVREDRDSRWGCGQVRDWLQGLKADQDLGQ